MAQLILIRHGQAAAFSEDSDRLTDLGERQARILGEHFVATDTQFDVVIRGSLRRHAQTEAEVAAAYQRAGKTWPTCQVVPGWNEYDAHGVMKVLGQALAARDPEFKRLVDDFMAKAADPDRNRYFQRMFEVLMNCWVTGNLELAEVEGFAAFHGRVAAALAELTAGSAKGKIAVFTSGGPIGVCVQETLGAPKRMALELNWRVRNSSLSELLFGRGRVSLDLFNAVPHLTDPALVSYR
jgi:broad specificity phosphatase PhoE